MDWLFGGNRPRSSAHIFSVSALTIQSLARLTAAEMCTSVNLPDRFQTSFINHFRCVISPGTVSETNSTGDGLVVLLTRC